MPTSTSSTTFSTPVAIAFSVEELGQAAEQFKIYLSDKNKAFEQSKMQNFLTDHVKRAICENLKKIQGDFQNDPERIDAFFGELYELYGEFDRLGHSHMITCKLLYRKDIQISLDPTDKIGAVKKALFIQTGWHPVKQTIIFKVKQLKDELSAADCSIVNDSIIHVWKTAKEPDWKYLTIKKKLSRF